jgi:hypothetical protein
MRPKFTFSNLLIGIFTLHAVLMLAAFFTRVECELLGFAWKAGAKLFGH